MTALIEARDLARYYGPVVGLNDVSLDVPGGTIGLLGPNGAGKSTLLKLIAGEIRPSRGTITVLGQAPFANPEYFRLLGFAPQQDALWGELTGLEMVTHLMRLSGFGARQARERAARALERVGLTDAMGRRIGGYSKGMRQRTKLAQAIAHEPRVLVVDEPMTGLDPIARRAMADLFREEARTGVHVIFSSHVLHEVEMLTQDVLLLHRGRLLAQGSVPEIRALLSKHPSRVELVAREPRALARHLVELACVRSVALDRDGRTLAVEAEDIAAFHAALPELVARAGAGVQALETKDAGLEAVFDYLVA